MLRALGWLSLAGATVITGAAAWRAVRQHQIAATLEMRSARAINDALYVRIGGVEQWVQIRGENPANPVLLILHGGPGMSYVPFTPWFREWEQHFTVVLWDRQGVGKTYAKNGEPPAGALTFDRLAADGIELTNWLVARLGPSRVILLGHSVGSVVGVLMAKQRPDLFAAYVGTDQIADMARNETLSYEMLVARAAASRDTALISSVAKVGKPPYATGDDWLRKQQLVSATDPISKSFEKKLFPMIMTAPNYSMQDMMAFGKGLKYSANALVGEMMTRDLYALGTDFSLPVVFILAEHDVIDPTPLAVEYFGRVRAPRKQLVLMKGAGHGALLMRPDEFLAHLLEHVRPIAGASAPKS